MTVSHTLARSSIILTAAQFHEDHDIDAITTFQFLLSTNLSSPRRIESNRLGARLLLFSFILVFPARKLALRNSRLWTCCLFYSHSFLVMEILFASVTFNGCCSSSYCFVIVGAHAWISPDAFWFCTIQCALQKVYFF